MGFDLVMGIVVSITEEKDCQTEQGSASNESSARKILVKFWNEAHKICTYQMNKKEVSESADGKEQKFEYMVGNWYRFVAM